MMKIRAFVFDMDGTLLNTLPDLVAAANDTLAFMGFPTRTSDEIESFMFGGAQHMIDYALPPQATPEQHAKAFDLWKSIYLERDYTLTAPYAGIVETLEALRASGAKTAILSNKFDAGVQALAGRFLPDLFDVARGEIPPAPRKPDPTTLLSILEEIRVRPQDAAYIGDTRIDMKLARNAGVAAIGVAWGYDKAAPLPIPELDAYIREPSELLHML